jgi:hypothetical protein
MVTEPATDLLLVGLDDFAMNFPDATEERKNPPQQAGDFIDDADPSEAAGSEE